MLKFFKLGGREPRGFGYQPRFYDADKEALENRVRAAEGRKTGNIDREVTKMRIREELRLAREIAKREHRGLWSGGILRLLIILGILTAAAYAALERWLPGLLHFWFPNY